MIALRSLLTFLLALSAVKTFSQPQVNLDEVAPRPSFAREIPKAELSEPVSRRYEAALSRALGEYYRPGSYIVDARAYLEENMVPLEMEPANLLDEGLKNYLVYHLCPMS